MSDFILEQGLQVSPLCVRKEVIRLRAELAASREREARMRDAAEQVIEMNRQHAKAMFGFSEKADSYPMVICLRAALAEGAQG